MPFLVEALISLLLIAGGVFVFIGSLGMAHLREPINTSTSPSPSKS